MHLGQRADTPRGVLLGLSTMRSINIMLEIKSIHPVLLEVARERASQDAKWGEQNHPDGTSIENKWLADIARQITNDNARNGTVTWLDIVNEEVSEASAEEIPTNLRAELIQSAAVLVAWVECIDRREANGSL